MPTQEAVTQEPVKTTAYTAEPEREIDPGLIAYGDRSLVTPPATMQEAHERIETLFEIVGELWGEIKGNRAVIARARHFLGPFED